MYALDCEALGAVCRSVYTQADANFILPPLIRDAANADAPPSYIYATLLEDSEIHFTVELEHIGPGRPIARFPLRFHAEMRQGDGDPIELGLGDRRHMIRAFLLGVHAPIIAADGDDPGKYEVSLQISSTYFVGCGDLIDKDQDVGSEAIYDRVGRGLYDRSQNLFATPEDGIAVWSARAAQELFGEPKPTAEELWPTAARQLAAPAQAEVDRSVSQPGGAPQQPQARSARLAAAAAIFAAAVGIGGLATAFGFHAAASHPTGISRTSDSGIASDRPVSERPGAARVPDAEALGNPYGVIRLAALEPIALPASIDLWRASQTTQMKTPDGFEIPDVAAAVPVKAQAARRIAAPKARPAPAATPKPRAKTQNANPIGLVRGAVASVTGALRKMKTERYRFSALNSPQASGP